MKILQKLLARRWRGKSHFAAFMLAAATAATAWSATPLAVWNGDFDQAPTRNGVTFNDNGNAVAEDGSTVTIASGSTKGISFDLPATYDYVTAVFTVMGVTGKTAANAVLVSTKSGNSAYGGVYVKSGSLGTGGINGTTAWSTTSADGTITSYDDAETTDVNEDATAERTFAVTQVNSDCVQNGMHLFEIVGGGTDATVVFGSNGNNGLRYALGYNVITIGGFQTTPSETGAIGTMEGLTLKSVAIYASNKSWPLDGTGRANFAMPLAFNIFGDTTLSAINAAAANYTDNVFVNFTADGLFLTADVGAASNLVFPYDTTITVAGTTLTVTGGMPVKVKPGSAITSIDGSGVILYDGDTEWTSFNTACATSSIFDSSWTGTVWIKNVGSLAKDSNNINACNKNLSNMARYGNPNSKVKFTNVKAYTPNVNTLDCPWTLVLEDGSGTDEYAWYNNTGWTGKTVTFKALEGDGTFYDPDNNKCRVVLQFNDASNFAGSIYARGKNIALGGAIFDTSFTESNAGTIQIPEGVSLTVATGKTWKAWYRIAVNGSVTMADTTANLIGTLSGGSTGRVCGKAPWQFGNTACNGSNSGWNGTVELASYTTTENVAVNLSYMGNLNSKIVLKGLVDNATTANYGPYIAPADGSTVSAEIVLDGDVEFGAANSGKTQTLNKISGSGNLTFSYTGSHTYNIKDVSGYTGTIAAKANSTVYVGVPTVPAVGDRIAKVDSTNNKVSTTIMQTNATGYPFAGELKLDGVYGLYAAVKATVGSTGYPTVAAALNAATASDTVVVNMTGETVSVDSITAASLTVNGTGTINVAGDVTVARAIIVADAALNVTGSISATTLAMNATNIDGRNRMNAASGNMPGQTSVTAASINAQVSGSGKVTTTAGTVLLGGDSATRLVGNINAADVTISGTGTTTLYGVNAISGTVTVSAGSTVALGNPYSLGTAVRNYDAANSVITEEDGYVTAVTDLAGGSTTCTPTVANVVKVVENDDSLFGGRKVFKMDTAKFQDGAKTATSHDMTTFLVWKHGGSAATWITPLNDSRSDGSASYQITTGNGNTSYYKFRNYGNNYSDQNFIFSNGETGNTYASGEQCLAVCGNWMLNENGNYYMQFGTGNSGSAIAEILIYNEDFTHDERAAIEAFLMAKWGIGSVTYAPFGTADVVLQTGSTIDLGGLTQTVQSLTGSGTVQNGALTVTDEINLSAGDVLTLPNTAAFTLGTVAAKIEDTTAGTVTLCGSVQDAIDNYTSGTLTILASETVSVAKEVTISGIVVADGAALTLTQVPPYTATFENDTLTCTRSAATFVYTGATAYSPVSGNFTIGGVATPAVPGTADTVQFDTATSIYIGSENIQYAAFILNADVTVTGAGTNYLRVNSYTGTGTLKLAGNGNLAPISGGATTIACPVEITNNNTLRVTAETEVTTITGKLTGAGKWSMAYARLNSGYSGNIFRCDASEFTGIIEELQCEGNVSRNFTRFGVPAGGSTCDFSGATVTLNSNRRSGYGKFLWANTGSLTYKFGSLSGKVSSTASEYDDNQHCYIEIGALGYNDTLTGDWISGNTGRNPYLRKVGTGTLTTSVTDTYGYILNGGTLVVMAAAAQAEVTTELAGYEVVSEVTYDTDEATVLYTTYTLNSTTRTWKGVTGNWSDGANWEEGSAPTSATSVTFPAGEYTVYLDVADAACAGMAVNGTVEFAQTGKALDVHNVLKLYGAVTGSGIVKLHHVGVENQSGAAIAFSPALVIEAPTANPASDSWFNTAAFEFGGNVTVEAGGRFIVYAAKPTFGAVTVTLGEGAYIGDWADKGFTFNGTTIAGSGTGAYLWAGNGGANSPIDGTGVTFQGAVTINNDYTNTKNYFDTTISATTVSMASGASITMKTENLSIASAPVAATTGHEIVVSTDSTAGTTTYTDVDNTASTWVGSSGDNWNDATKWSTGVLPKRYTDVTIPETFNGTIYITSGAWPAGGDREIICRNLTVNGTVKLQELNTGWCYLTLFGDVNGSGSLTIKRAGLDNMSGRQLNVGCKLYVDYYASSDSYCVGEAGFVFEDVGVWSLFKLNGATTFKKLTLGANADIVADSATGVVTIETLAVDASASPQLEINKGSFTLAGTVTLEGTDSTLTVPANANVSGATFKCGVNGYKVVGPTENVYSVAVDTNITPGGTSIGYDTETAATTAAASYTVVLTKAQEDQGLQASYYTTSVVYDSETGKWVVTAVFDESVVGGNLVETATVNVSAGTVTLGAANLQPGLCYRIVSGSDAGAMTTVGAWSDYYDGKTAPTLSAKLPTGSATMYYSVEASDTSDTN